MSIENAHRLVRTIGSDAEFRRQLANVGPVEQKGLLESAGFGDVTREEVQAAATVSATGELTDAELEAVAGGAWYDWAVVVAAAAATAAAV